MNKVTEENATIPDELYTYDVYDIEDQTDLAWCVRFQCQAGNLKGRPWITAFWFPKKSVTFSADGKVITIPGWLIDKQFDARFHKDIVTLGSKYDLLVKSGKLPPIERTNHAKR